MILRSLRLQDFRAHEGTVVAFAPKVNLIYGRNGAGKTNLLEAVHYLCLSKSFIASQDAYVLRKGTSYFEVEGTFEGEQRAEMKVRLVYKPDEGKRIFVNGAPLDRLADIVGQLPVVVLAPADHALTAGGPEERRKFLDNTLSQARPVYLDDLLKYRRALKQRNALLLQAKRTRRYQPELLDSWNEELVVLGTRLIMARQQFLLKFADYLNEAYRQIDAIGEEPKLTYQSIATLRGPVTETEVAALFQQRLAENGQREREQGRSLVGPHRDEIRFQLNDFDVRRYASQGQHRTFGMALKLAKYFYLKERRSETPILLLDDVFGDLDAHRTQVFLSLLQSDTVGQTLITAAGTHPFDGMVPFGAEENQQLHVRQGQAETHSVSVP